MIFLFYLIVGLGVGVLTSAPVGPVNIMVIRHAVLKGGREGLLVGSGAAVGDTVFAAFVVFGISAVTGFIEGQADWIKLVGASVLFVFGYRVFTAHPEISMQNDRRIGPALQDCIAAFVMTVTNPGVLLGYVALLGNLGSWRPAPGDWLGSLMMVSGVLVGALLWWSALSLMVARSSETIDNAWLEKANKVAGLLLIIFAAVILASLALDYAAEN